MITFIAARNSHYIPISWSSSGEVTGFGNGMDKFCLLIADNLFYDASEENRGGIPFVFAKNGFGNIENCYLEISEIKELIECKEDKLCI